MPHPTVQSMVDSVEREAHAYEIGGLQPLRVQLRGLARMPTTRIFGRGIFEEEGYAYHSGGREELQFNLGFDQDAGKECIRAGVAFSFEPSRSLPDVALLQPLAGRFNTFIEINADAFPDASMWHWQDGARSADYQPTVIPADLMRPETFVFMGERSSLDTFDPHWALGVFDRLLSIYKYVMASGSVDPTLEPPSAFVFRPRRISGDAEQMQVSTVARTLGVELRHRLLQKQLCDELTTSLGAENVSEEAVVCGCRADVVTSEADGYVLYEIKTASTARACLREGIGQLLEYGFWPTSLRPSRLVICGEPEPDDKTKVYLEALNAAFPAPVAYRQIVI